MQAQEERAFETFLNDLQLSEAQKEPFVKDMFAFTASLCFALDKYDKLDADPVLVYETISKEREEYFATIGEKYGAEKAALFADRWLTIHDDLVSVISLSKVAYLKQVVNPEKNYDEVYTGVSASVRGMMQVVVFFDYVGVEDYKKEPLEGTALAAVEQLREGKLNAGYTIQNDELKRVLTADEYQKWLGRKRR